MQQYPIKLGPVGLRDFEVPSAIKFGGTQRLAVHRLYGGARVVECLGPEPAEIQFEGAFTGADASMRLRTVDAMRINGEVVWLSWEAFRYSVVVQHIQAEYRNPWWIGFRISCIVATELQTQSTSLASLIGIVSADLGNVLGVSQAAGIDVSSLQGALQSPSTLALVPSDQAAARSAAYFLIGQIDNLISTQSGIVTAGVSLSGAAIPASSAFTTTVGAAGQLANAAIARAYVSRIAMNLQGGLS